MRPSYCWLALSVAALAPAKAGAAEIRVLSAPNMRGILSQLTSKFEQETGHRLQVTYASPSAVTSRVSAGEQTDVAITLRPSLNALAKEGKIKQVATLARSFIAVVTRPNVRKPDISSRDAFKTSLLNAKSVVYSDPTKGGLSGVFTDRLIHELGISEQMRPKTKLVPPGGPDLVKAMQAGEADVGIDQPASVQDKPGLIMVGVLPPQFGVDIVMGVGVSAASDNTPAAQTLVKYLTSPPAAAVIKSNGMEPG